MWRGLIFLTWGFVELSGPEGLHFHQIWKALLFLQVFCIFPSFRDSNCICTRTLEEVSQLAEIAHFLATLGFEFETSCLLNRCSTTWATPPALSDSRVYAWAHWDHNPHDLQLPSSWHYKCELLVPGPINTLELCSGKQLICLQQESSDTCFRFCSAPPGSF
jgi:hypothetical protein